MPSMFTVGVTWSFVRFVALYLIHLFTKSPSLFSPNMHASFHTNRWLLLPDLPTLQEVKNYQHLSLLIILIVSHLVELESQDHIYVYATATP